MSPYKIKRIVKENKPKHGKKAKKQMNYKNEEPLPVLTHKQMTQALIPIMKTLGVYQEFKCLSDKYLLDNKNISDKSKFYIAKKILDKAFTPAKERLAMYAKEDKEKAEKGILVAR